MPRPTPTPEELDAARRAGRTSPLVFGVAVFALVWIGVSLATARNRDLVAVLVSVLLLGGAGAMMWTRWIGGRVEWFLRALAGVGAAVLVAVVLGWLGRADVFVDCRPGCPPRVGTFWPLLMAWVGAFALFAGALWGSRFEFAQWLRPGVRTVLTWVALLAWTGLCLVVLARNVTVDVVMESMERLGIVTSIGGGVVGLLIGVSWLLSLKDRRTRRELAADFARMTPAQRGQVLAAIDAHARTGEFQLAFRGTGVADDAAPARLGGDPVLRPGEAWPHGADGEPGIFLLQLPLAAPRLPRVWHDRVASVFLVDYELLVKLHRVDEAPSLVRVHGPDVSIEVMPEALEPLAIPYVAATDDLEEATNAEALVALVPGLAALLRSHSAHPGRLLDAILAGGVERAPASELVMVGGDPVLLLDDPAPLCAECGAPMRFLFQFGDVTESFAFGDAGVGYVYGCDAHPERCEGFVESC
jgi:hypothetical protein